MTKEFVTITFSDKLNVMKSCLSPNHSSGEIKRLGDKSCSSAKTIFLVVKVHYQLFIFFQHKMLEHCFLNMNLNVGLKIDIL